MKFLSVSFVVLSLGAIASAVPMSFGRKPTPVVADRSISGALDTNAKRLAAGLPPLPARKLWSPTASAKRWNTSPVPHTGKVGVTAKNGTALGFISRILNPNGEYTLDPAETNAATIFFAAANSIKSTKLSLRDQTSNSTNATFFGAVIPRTYFLVNGNAQWKRQEGQNQTDHVTIAGVAQTAPDASPQQVPTTIQGTSDGNGGTGGSGGGTGPSGPNGSDTGATGQDGESSIWGYNPDTQQWSSTWTNYDGSTADTIPYYNPSAADQPSSIALVSDTQSYLTANPQAVEINLSFVI